MHFKEILRSAHLSPSIIVPWRLNKMRPKIDECKNDKASVLAMELLLSFTNPASSQQFYVHLKLLGAPTFSFKV